MNKIGNMFAMLGHKKACPIIRAAVASALMNHAIDEEYKSTVLQDEGAVAGLGFCLGNGRCAWWDDSRQCCGVIAK